VTGSGLVRPLRGRSAGGFEPVHPLVLAMPALGQVHGEVTAAVPVGARGQVNQVAADGGTAGFAVGQAGEGGGRAEQVAADRGEARPGAVGGQGAGGQVGERAVAPVGEDLLGPGVAAVVLFGLERHERGVGEDGVVAPGGEQLALAGGRGVAVEVADPSSQGRD
jgi:hypothetical protein